MIRLERVRLVSADPEALAAFYTEALGFSRGPTVRGPGETLVPLRLGAQALDLVGYDLSGRPYPAEVSGWSPLFQHVAIVLSDMGRAHARLAGYPGWRPISTAGPERLPAASGGVTAFKFRDPEGHPLELLAFPPGGGPEIWRRPASDVCLGLDHSAISVAETDASLAFYRDLGFSVLSQGINTGPEQARLDGMADPRVAVTGLTPPGAATPHLELLCYAGAFPRAGLACADHDIAATVLVFSGAEAVRPLRDPDGHRLLLT